MKKREEDQYNMQQQVKKYLDSHSDKWSMIPAILRYKNELDENLQAIREKEAGNSESSQPITASKNELKETVALKTAVLAGAIAAYAAEKEDKALARVAEVSNSSLYKLSEAAFSAPVKAIIDAAKEHLKALADQGVSREQVKELETALDDFDELSGKPRSIQISSALAAKEVSELVVANQNLLSGKLDKTMLRFRLTDPLFFEGYERSRVIVG